jgi:hypothetical protein
MKDMGGEEDNAIVNAIGSVFSMQWRKEFLPVVASVLNF